MAGGYLGGFDIKGIMTGKNAGSKIPAELVCYVW